MLQDEAGRRNLCRGLCLLDVNGFKDSIGAWMRRAVSPVRRVPVYGGTHRPDTGHIQAYSVPRSRRDLATDSSQFRPQVFVSAAREFFHGEFESTIGSQNGSHVRLRIFATAAGCGRLCAVFSRRDGKRERSFGHVLGRSLRYAKNAAYSFGFGRSRRDNFGRPKKPLF